MTTTIATPVLTDCPPWCGLPAGHPLDSIHDPATGLMSRGHAGPDFGPYVSVGSCEFNNAPGVHQYDVTVAAEAERDVESLTDALELARNLILAAAWLADRAEEA